MRSIIKRALGLGPVPPARNHASAQVALYGSFEPSKSYVSSIHGYDAYALTNQAMGMLAHTYSETSEAYLAVEEGEEDWSPHDSGMTTFIQMGWGYRWVPPIVPAVKCVEYATSMAGVFGFDGLRMAFPISRSAPYQIYKAFNWGVPAPVRQIPGQILTVYISFNPQTGYRSPRGGRGDWLRDVFTRWRDDMRPEARNIYSMFETIRLELVDISVVSFPEVLGPTPVGFTPVDWSQACRLSFRADSFTIESAAMCVLILGSVLHATGLEAKLELSVALQGS